MTAQVNSKMCIDFLAGGFKDFFNFHPYYLGKMMPFWLIFFRWVCSTTNQFFMFFNHLFTPKLVGNFILFWWKPIEQQPIETFHRRKSQKKLYKWWKATWPFFSPGFDIFWGGAHCYNAAWTWNFPWVSTSRFVRPALGLAVTHGRKMGG